MDWTNPRADLSRKESKRRTLVDVVELSSSGYPFVFTPEVQRPLIAAVSANLFRALPVGSATDDGLDAEDDEPRLEPAWPHVQVSYEVLRRFIVSNETDPKVACAVVDQPFVASLLSLFDSEDPREREYLKTILHRIYGKFMPLRVFIRRAITHTFHRFVYETQRQRTATAYRHHGAAELLEILGSIINGFTLPLKQEHKMFLRRTLLPLHVPKSLPSYHGQLSFCITQFVEKDPTLAVDVISGLLKLWPQTATRKAVLCLGELEEVLELTRPAQFAAVLPQLFRQISECIESPHFQIAERALFFWNNEYIVNLIVHHRERVVPFVFGALQRNAEDHWNPNVRSLSYNVQKLLAEMDNALYQRSAAHYVVEKDSSRAREHQRACSWVAAENLAAARKRQVGSLSSAVSGGTDDGGLLDSAVSSALSTAQPASVAPVVVANGVAVPPSVPSSSFSPTCSSETPHTMPVSAASTAAEQPPPTSSMPVPVPKGSSGISGSAVTSPPLSIALAAATAGEAPITVSASSTPASTGSTTSPVSVVDAPAASVLIPPSSLEPLDVAPPTEGSRSTCAVNIDSSATSTRPSEDAANASPLLTAPPPWTPPTLRAAESRSTVSDSNTIGLPSSPTSVSPSSSVADGAESRCTRAPTAVDLDADSSQRMKSPKPGRSTASDGKTQGNDASSSTGDHAGTSLSSSTPTVVGATRSRRSGGSGRSAKAAANAAAAAAAAAIAAAFPSVSSPPSKKSLGLSASSAPKDARPLTASSPSNGRRPELASDRARAVPKTSPSILNASLGSVVSNALSSHAPGSVTADGRETDSGSGGRDA